MSSSSKLSFQSGDSPSARRKSWPGFHGLKALDFEEGSREQQHSHLPSPCLCTEQRGLPFQMGRAPERLPDAPGKPPASPPPSPPHIPSVLPPDLQSLESARLFRALPGLCQLRDLLNMWGRALLWSAWEKRHTAKPSQH